MLEVFNPAKVLQLLISLTVISLGYGIYRRSRFEILRDRFETFSLAFASYSLAVLSEILIDASIGNYGVLLVMEHLAGLAFFLLISTFGILHFAEQNHANRIKKGSYFIGVAISLTTTLYTYISWNARGEIAYAYEIAMLFHILEILAIIGIGVFVIRKIFQTNSSLNPFFLHRKYPFGIGVLLLMVTVISHLVLMAIERTHATLYIFMETIMDSVIIGALLIVTYCTFRAYENVQRDSPRSVPLERNAEELTHILRLIYYGLVDVGIGEREILLNEFLESTKLREFYDERHVILKEDRIQDEIEKEPHFAMEICEGMLMFFKKHPRFLSDAQTQYFVVFMERLSNRKGFNEGHYKRLWERLSAVYQHAPSINLGKHFSKLSTWGATSTYAFFEKRHPTGIRRLDEKTGGIPGKSLTLALKSVDVDKSMLFNPALMMNLGNMRNVIYIVPDSLDKILSDLGGMERFLLENRLKIVSLLPDATEFKEVMKNCYVIKEHSKELVSFLSDFIRDFPLSSITVLIDLNFLVIKESPSDIYSFIRAIKDLSFTKNATVYACISNGADPEKVAVLRENAEVAFSVDKIDESLYYRILKSDLSVAPAGRLAIERELYDLLCYVNKENCEGRKPNFRGVQRSFAISAGTVRKRVNELQKIGFLKIHKAGRLKLLEITDSGREHISSAAIHSHEVSK